MTIDTYSMWCAVTHRHAAQKQPGGNFCLFADVERLLKSIDEDLDRAASGDSFSIAAAHLKIIKTLGLSHGS